jgi:hypothetical protein
MKKMMPSQEALEKVQQSLHNIHWSAYANQTEASIRKKAEVRDRMRRSHPGKPSVF